MTQKAFKYRFYPTPEQETLLRRTMGCTRLVYNRALALRTEAWHEKQEQVGYKETSGMLTAWKKQEELIDIRWSRQLPENTEPSTITIKLSPAGRWTVSLLVDVEIELLPESSNSVGVDLGIISLVALSTGTKIPNPKNLKKKRKKLRRVQKALSRKQKGSKNRHKAKLKVAKVHQEITDARKDFLHKLTTRLVRENQTIAVENLAVKNMLRNHKLAQAISDASWGELIRSLERGGCQPSITALLVYGE
jgi:IS605 OrfB family transposase